jgi:hypothetical protein
MLLQKNDDQKVLVTYKCRHRRWQPTEPFLDEVDCQKNDAWNFYIFHTKYVRWKKKSAGEIITATKLVNFSKKTWILVNLFSGRSGSLLKPLLWVADYSGAIPLNKWLEKRLEKWDFLMASCEKPLPRVRLCSSLVNPPGGVAQTAKLTSNTVCFNHTTSKVRFVDKSWKELESYKKTTVIDRLKWLAWKITSLKLIKS